MIHHDARMSDRAAPGVRSPRTLLKLPDQRRAALLVRNRRVVRERAQTVPLALLATAARQRVRRHPPLSAAKCATGQPPPQALHSTQS